ncbi:hypothetical protein GQ600_22290 [Phytophthora cactorum]|nr:hypothetical protein GQ600_22290 [Phytophthora cactorum]
MPSSPTDRNVENYRMPATGYARWVKAQRMLLIVWLAMGVLPLALQIRSYTQFVRPAKLSEILVVPQDQQKETTNLTEVCPVEALVLAGVWWNFEPTHYYHTDNGTICHAVIPQYNSHGNYSSGVQNSWIVRHQRVFLAKDTGSRKARVSYWYGIVGAFWLGYRALMIRKGYVLCTRYGRRCDELGETLCQEQAVVFVQESLRLSAHGASNYQRAALLYLIVEGIMTDLFLIIANDGWATRVQYGSLGYNLSGLMLLLFEMVESMNWLSEKWRMRIKRVFFSYEVALVGELVTALGLQAFLSG